MINRLRRHIIAVNMALVGTVILMIFAVVCFNNYNNAKDELLHGMNQLIERDFRVGMMDKDRIPPDGTVMIGKRQFDGEKPMQITSYVSVTVNADGNIINTKESNVTINEDTLKKCVAIVLKENGFNGEIGEYSLMYVKRDEMSRTRIVFADNSSIYSTLRSTVMISLGLFAVSMMIIFLISLALSGLAVNPVKKAWEQQKQFVADASHELKTPLTVILANNNIMMSHADSRIQDESQWLESTQEEATHMKQLIDQMLFLAKSDAGTSQPQLSKVNFSEIVEASSLNFEPVAFEKEIDIATEILPEIVLHGNGTQLNQLVHILIDNAVKYADSKTTVTIRLIKKNDTVEFSVNNFGNVISKEDINHIFDRFYRAEKSRTTKGYGLGLSIAQRIVQSMDGKLSVVSNTKNGTTFTAFFTLNI